MLCRGCAPPRSRPTTLPMAISALGEELAADGTIADSALFRMAVEGTPRNLHPILRDEVYRIAGETLRNAFRHAQARQIEVGNPL
jgi:signal transduction histidine kinase